MARPRRFCPIGSPQHIIQRGNNRQACFASDGDMAAYAHWLWKGAVEYSVAIHAWVFMTNHVHLLATPAQEDAISRMMQYIGRHYVRHFNEAYHRSGTLWEGRFKSCLVQENNYFLQCQRYIELNPVRAKMVSDPADYVWSSYRVNALGIDSKLRSPHALYMALGSTEPARRAAYRGLFATQVDKELLDDIRHAVNKGLVLGTERFKAEIEASTGQRARLRKRGPKRAKNKFGDGDGFLL